MLFQDRLNKSSESCSVFALIVSNRGVVGVLSCKFVVVVCKRLDLVIERTRDCLTGNFTRVTTLSTQEKEDLTVSTANVSLRNGIWMNTCNQLVITESL